MEITTLKELLVGDRFIAASSKDKSKAVRYTVYDRCEFNSGAGTSTRRCLNEKTRKIEDKKCILSVIKLPII